MDAQGGLGSLSPTQRAQLMDQMKTEVAIANVRELMDVSLVLTHVNFAAATDK